MPVRYFQRADDDYYYQIKGKNGEVMATSEGYSTESNAHRGFQDLADEVISMIKGAEMQDAEGSRRAAGGSGEVSEPEHQADVQEADQELQGDQEAKEGSRHDEPSGDNPSALSAHNSKEG